VTKLIWAWGPPVAWAAFIFVMSSIPGTALPEMPAVNFDKVIHAGVYGVLSALIWRALRNRPITLGRATVLAVTFATLFGVTDELHQLFTPNRSADWRDGIADLVGALAGALACVAIATRKRRARRER
jgi:VanZ family protein